MKDREETNSFVLIYLGVFNETVTWKFNGRIDHKYFVGIFPS